MKPLPALASLLAVTFALSPAAVAQQGLTPKQQWQLWQQQQAQQGKAPQPQPQAKAKRPVAAAAGSAWSSSTRGSGGVRFQGGNADPLVSGAVTLNGFNTGANSGTASVILSSSNPYRMTGTWAINGPVTAALRLTPVGNTGAISGTLTMGQDRQGNPILGSISLAGTMGGQRFNASYTPQ